MSEPLVVATPFGELGELAEHFAQRVDGGRLMLPYPNGVDDGQWLQFQVLYADGSVAMEGTGKVSGSYDNGEEHPPEYRFDIVLEELTLDGTSEVVFERIVVARESMMSADPGTGEVQIPDEVAADPIAVEPVTSEPPMTVDDAALEAEVPEPITGLEAMEEDAGEDIDDLIESAPAPTPARAPAAAPAAPRANPRGAPVEPGKLPTPHSFEGGVLTRPVLPAAWEPNPEPRPDAAAGTGLFEYARNVTGSVLPRPASPPRPELPEEARVGHAPAPAPAS